MARHMDQRCGDIAKELWGDNVACFETPTLGKAPSKVSVWFAIEEMIMDSTAAKLELFASCT